MFNYMGFIYGGVENADTERPGGAMHDGVRMAKECISQLRELDPYRFPPRLLILLASPAYLESRRAQQLLDGVQRGLADQGYPDVPLIGSTAAAVFFRGKVHPEGALLICLASRLLDVKVGFSSTAGVEPECAAEELLKKLELDREAGEDPNPFANRALLTFLPGNTGQGYLATKLHNCLRERVWARVPIVGGVSSGYDGRSFRPGLQFAGRRVYKNYSVVALLTTRTLLGLSINDGLERTKCILHATAVNGDRHTVEAFDHRPASDVLNELREQYGFVVLGKRTFHGEPVIERPWPVAESPSVVRLLGRVHQSDTYRVLRVVPDQLTEGTSDSIERSCKSIGLGNAAGCLGFRCSGYFASRSEIGLDLSEEITQVESKLGILDRYVGAFVDGEIGKDNLGRSQLRGWSTAAVVFGDELRHRAAVYEGFRQVANFLSRHPSQKKPPEESVEALLKLIYDIGYPGVRLLLLLKDNTGWRLVVPERRYTIGSLVPPSDDAFPHYIKLDTDDSEPEDPSATVERKSEPLFLSYEDVESAETSYYYTPLKTIKDRIMAILQIDVGKQKRLRKPELDLLMHLGVTVGASLNRIFTWQENSIRNRLQDALRDSLRFADTAEGVQNYLVEAVKALGLRMGHIRRRNDKYQLELCAGLGEYYEAAREVRPAIDYGDSSPTTEACVTNKIIIVNDAPNDPDHERMINRWRDARDGPDGRIRRALEKVESYANIPFSSSLDVQGTINLVANQRWFFKHPQRKLLTTIGEQVEFLVDHLEQKSTMLKALDEAEEARAGEQETNERLEFLLNVSHQLGGGNLEEFNDSLKKRVEPENPLKKRLEFKGTLKKLLERFCKTVRAEVGSLYLWDDARELYILRAEYGWAKPEFVDVAAYTKDAGWFGIRALQGEPRHIPDLFEYYRQEGYHRPTKDGSKPGGMYSEYMFGQKLSEDFSVEALGLPLKIGRDKEIGVLALYRTLGNGQTSGFLPIVVSLLADRDSRRVVTEATYDVSALIATLLQHQEDEVEKWEQRRRGEISDEFTSHIEDPDDKFMETICHTVSEKYAAVRSDLYRAAWRKGAAGPEISLEVSHPPRPDAEPADAAQSDQFLAAASTAYYALRFNKRGGKEPGGKARYIKVRRKSLTPRGRNDPREAATEGLVERVCLPLYLDEHLMWMLDLHWDVSTPRPYEVEPRLDKKYLWQLAEDISKFSRLHLQTVRRIRAEQEATQHLKAQRELLGKVGVVAQLAHTWRDRINELTQSVAKIKGIEDDQRRACSVDELLAHLGDLRKLFVERLKLIENDNLQRRRTNIRDLIGVKDEAEETTVVSKRRKKSINCTIKIPDDLRLHVAPLLMGLAFENVIDNVVQVMEETPDVQVRLEISAVPDPKHRYASVRFANNGKQMEPRYVNAINNNRYQDLGHKWGLVIAKSFAESGDGNLIIETLDGGGTALIFTLPMAQKEE